MSEDFILLEKKSDVAFVTMNRPDVHNAMNEHVIAKLHETFNDLNQADDIKVVVVRGAGKSFSAGADLQWMLRAADFSYEENLADAQALADMLRAFNDLKQMTIGCVQGAAMGGGLGLASCCDLVIADENTTFALSEVKLGLIPATISPYVIAAIGPRQARRYFQTGERFKGAKAFEMGLAHEVTAGPEEMQAKLDDILGALKTCGPNAMQASKKLVLDFAGKPVTSEIGTESAKRIADTRMGDEAREGLQAFFDKRKACWIKE